MGFKKWNNEYLGMNHNYKAGLILTYIHDKQMIIVLKVQQKRYNNNWQQVYNKHQGLIFHDRNNKAKTWTNQESMEEM